MPRLPSIVPRSGVATISPNGVTRFVRGIVAPRVRSPRLDRLPLTGYHAWHAARAEMLRRLGRTAEAKDSYDAAIAATQNSAERAYLGRKRGELV